jgi:hypothetical protein
VKIKCRVEEDGSLYVAALNPRGEHRKSATVPPGSEITIDVPGVSNEDGLDFGEVMSSSNGSDEAAGEGEAPAGGDSGTDTPKDDPAPETASQGSEDESADGAIPGLYIGRSVIYRSRTGSYDVPAVVNATVETLDPAGVESGNVPALSGNACVHLTVFTPGKPGTGSDDPAIRTSENLGGSYQEWDIGMASDSESPEPGSWRWPDRR